MVADHRQIATRGPPPQMAMTDNQMHLEAANGKSRSSTPPSTPPPPQEAAVSAAVTDGMYIKLGQKSSIHLYIYIIPELYKLADCRQTCLQSSETSLSGCIQQRTLTSHKICYREDLVDCRPTCLPLDIRHTEH